MENASPNSRQHRPSDPDPLLIHKCANDSTIPLVAIMRTFNWTSLPFWTIII